MLFSEIYWERALYDLLVEYNYPANSGPEMLLQLLKVLISISDPIFTDKTHKLSSFHL